MKANLKSHDYPDFLRQIVAEIKTSRITAARKVNREMIMLYWKIGELIAYKKLTQGYGKSVVERLSMDLKMEFPGSTGFSSRNLWDMKRFYETYNQQDDKLRQVVAELPWGHHLLILYKTRQIDEAIFYINNAVEYSWTRDILLNQIKSNAFRIKKIPKQHNFLKTLPEHIQEQANEMIKSEYNLGFLDIVRPILERDLERRLVEKIKQFMLELGKGFSFIGNQYKLVFADDEYFVDLLFYHRGLKCLVAVELKIGKFIPEYIGKMNFYLSLLDDTTKLPGENPSIGLILCADKKHLEVELALRDVAKPIAVSEYQLSALIPDKMQLRKIINEEIKKHELEKPKSVDPAGLAPDEPPAYV
jgi:predicted nuclease of restriction endonuclease-like (RecB) superfamily